MKAHPQGKFLSTASSGVYTFKFHSRDEWLSYSNAFDNHDLGSYSLTEYLKFCSLFCFIPQTNDMIAMRIYVELFSLLTGMEYCSLREKRPGHLYQHIIDEINDLRRIKYLNPMISLSGRYLLALMLQSPQWMNLRFPQASTNSPAIQSLGRSHGQGPIKPLSSVHPSPVFKLGSTPLEVIPSDVRDIIRCCLPPHDGCKVSLVSNPMLSININQVSSLLNGSSWLQLELDISKAKSLSIAQCIINGACQWLDHLSVFKFFLATISCVATGPYRFSLPSTYAPLLVPLPSSTFTDQYLIDSNNFIKFIQISTKDAALPISMQ